jgi:hypothetical protein
MKEKPFFCIKKNQKIFINYPILETGTTYQYKKFFVYFLQKRNLLLASTPRTPQQLSPR